MEQKFADILDNGEQIKVCYTPSKKKLYISSFIALFFVMLFVAGFVFLTMLPEDVDAPVPDFAYIIAIAVFAVGYLLGAILVVVHAKKVVYALTDKRIIIRTGVIGVDFKCLDLKSIGATEVYVSFLDKLLGGKTGTIRFGSMSSPINGNNVPYAFANIVKPYETYKLLKEDIEKVKA